jgi:hypothetical protein
MAMRAKLIVAGGFFGLAGILGFLAGPGTGAERSRTSALLQDEVVAGSPGDFMEVRHIRLKGSNEEIGRALAMLAQERFGATPSPSADPPRTRAQRHFLERNYPYLLERMRGVAAAFGKSVEDDAFDFGSLGYTKLRGGCSVVYFPPTVMENNSGLVSRDYDFSTGTLRGTRPAPGELAATARPYIVELHPDRGIPSIAIYSYDLLSGVLDGMNAEGLTVALLADDELLQKYRMEPAFNSGVGLGVQQILRLLLDTCANVEEAKETLLSTKQFYEFLPCHYLVADRFGKAFVWEYSQAHNREYIVENPGKPLITTNFSLHSRLEDNHPPSAAKAKPVCPRYCLLCERIGQHQGPLSVDFIKDTHHQVDAVRSGGAAPNRTLWHALYQPEQRKLQVSFYMGDEPAQAAAKRVNVRRSPYVEFGLAKD